jgi:hypothetical protein
MIKLAFFCLLTTLSLKCTTSNNGSRHSEFFKCLSKREVSKLFKQKDIELQYGRYEILQALASEPYLRITDNCDGLYFVTYKTSNPNVKVVLPVLKFETNVYFRKNIYFSDTSLINNFVTKYQNQLTKSQIQEVKEFFLEYALVSSKR